MPLKDARIHSRGYQKIQQKDDLNKRIYNLLRCQDVRAAKQVCRMFSQSTETLPSSY